jgi:hypothetical protein
MSPVEEQQHQSPDDDEYTYLSRESPGCIQEEVHGVNCVTPEETPELLRTSLAKLATILDSNDVIPEQDKKSYLASQKLKSSSSSSTTCCCYVNTDDFRLRFLRAELFDVHRAARTLTKFLNLVEAVFGSFALERPVRLDDFDKDELKALRKGCIQFLPIRDRSGRRIMIVFPGDEMEKIDRSVRVSTVLYVCLLGYIYLHCFALAVVFAAIAIAIAIGRQIRQKIDVVPELQLQLQLETLSFFLVR